MLLKRYKTVYKLGYKIILKRIVMYNNQQCPECRFNKNLECIKIYLSNTNPRPRLVDVCSYYFDLHRTNNIKNFTYIVEQYIQYVSEKVQG